MEDLRAASVDDLLSVKAVNKRAASSILDYFADPKEVEVFGALRQVELECLATSKGQNDESSRAEDSSRQSAHRRQRNCSSASKTSQKGSIFGAAGQARTGMQ